MNQKNKEKWKSWAFSALQFVIILFFTCFVVTVSFILFFTFFESDLTFDMIWESAVINLGNVFFISLIFWASDSVWRKFTVERPVNEIVQGLERITNGDFSVRIKPLKRLSQTNQYQIIIQNINQLAAELEGVETLRTDFVSNVSHEMKTPLAVIQNYTALLRPSDLSETERLEYLNAISQSTERLAGLVSNILKLNKLENQQIFPKNQPYDLSEQICECLFGFETQFEEQIEIQVDIEENVIIQADEELMNLVWNNLFSNAVKFTESGGCVSVQLKKLADTVMISVSDTGCGMSAETMKHIFDKFYQGDTSHAGCGNGLGLALAKRITDISGGAIAVRSEIGKGSTFTVTLKADKPKSA